MSCRSPFRNIFGNERAWTWLKIAIDPGMIFTAKKGNIPTSASAMVTIPGAQARACASLRKRVLPRFGAGLSWEWSRFGLGVQLVHVLDSFEIARSLCEQKLARSLWKACARQFRTRLAWNSDKFYREVLVQDVYHIKWNHPFPPGCEYGSPKIAWSMPAI